MAKLIGISGSLRKGSYNSALLRAAAAMTPAGTELIIGDIHGIPLYDGDVEAQGIPPAVASLKDAIAQADGLIIVTPEYNNSMPGVMKNAIDWLSRMKEQPFKEKPVAIQSCSQGPLGGARMQYHWRMSMTFLNAFIFGTPEVFVGSAATKFDKDTLELKDQPTKDAIKTQLAAFAKFIKRMKAGA